MSTFYLYWESESGIECFVCKALSEYDAKQKAKAENPEIIDCLVETQNIEDVKQYPVCEFKGWMLGCGL